MYYHATLIFLLSIGFPVPQIGTMLIHATHYPAHQMAHHQNGQLMHVTIKIALPINVKSAVFVLVLMGIVEQYYYRTIVHVPAKT